jgi:hypothetical protein
MYTPCVLGFTPLHFINDMKLLIKKKKALDELKNKKLVLLRKHIGMQIGMNLKR